MNLAAAGSLAFASGVFYEGLSIVWVHQAMNGSPLSVAVISAFQAAAMVFGVGESVKQWRVAPMFIAGYGVGAWAAMVWA